MLRYHLFFGVIIFGKTFPVGNFEANGATTSNYVTPVPPLSSNVIITGHNKWGIPSTKITSGGVTVTTSPRVRPHSQGPSTLMGSTGALGKLSGNALNQSTGSIGLQQNAISVHHASPASPTFQSNQKSVMTLPINSTLSSASNVTFFMPFVRWCCSGLINYSIFRTIMRSVCLARWL